MFDIGFWELCLIAVVALLILGPERLPIAARTAGLWIGKARRMIGSVKSEIDRELQLDEVRRRLQDEEVKLREDSGIGDLEILASNSIADVKKVKEGVDNLSDTMERDSGKDKSNSNNDSSESDKSS